MPMALCQFVAGADPEGNAVPRRTNTSSVPSNSRHSWTSLSTTAAHVAWVPALGPNEPQTAVLTQTHFSPETLRSIPLLPAGDFVSW